MKKSECEEWAELCKLSAYKEIMCKTPRHFTNKEILDNNAHKLALPYITIPYPKDNPEEEIEVHQEQVYEVPHDRVTCSPSNAPVLPHFPGYLLE